jgi:vancomycin resistance protein YoaR
LTLIFILTAAAAIGCGAEQETQEKKYVEENGYINEPLITDRLTESTIEIGSAVTPLLDRSKTRINNIKLACEYLYNLEIRPGEEFSFNGELGKRTNAKGYKKAPVIIRTKDGPKKGYGTGGGICQLSSTLYNAVDDAGLKITERHNHSKSVGYVEKGRDAAVVYGKKDFKFVNSRPNTVIIRTYLDEDSLTVKIFENRS